MTKIEKGAHLDTLFYFFVERMHSTRLCRGMYFLVHTAHAAHTGVAGGHRGFGFLDVAEDALGGEEHAGDRGGVLQSHAGYLGGVDDTALLYLDRLEVPRIWLL